jgi:hypothetical protein
MVLCFRSSLKFVAKLVSSTDFRQAKEKGEPGMHATKTFTRRDALRQLALAMALAPIGALRQARAGDAASLPLLSVDAPEAKAVKYVENARQAQDKVPDSSCANCGLYQGASGSTQGPCQLFPGKAVTAAGWCASWAPQM